MTQVALTLRLRTANSCVALSAEVLYSGSVKIPSFSLMRALAFFLAVAPLCASGGTWQPLHNQPPVPDIIDPANNADLGPGGASFPLLLTDGSVIVQNTSAFGASGQVYKLTPDNTGSYVNGTWTRIASIPYIPTAAAQAVLADGRVLIEGGEFSGVHQAFTLTNQGAIYNPVTNTWAFVTPPAFFTDLYPPRAAFAPHPIGDAASVVLADGTFMLQDKMSRQAALLNIATMTWTEVGTATKADLNDEEGWTLLPNGKVLTVDCYTDFTFGLRSSYPKNPTGSEIFDPVTKQWRSAGSTIHTLTDRSLSEIGAQILRPNGTLFVVGSQGYSSVYNVSTGTWTAGPRLGLSPSHHQLTAQDAPAAILPNGRVFFAASGGAIDPNNGYSLPPVAFFEFDGFAFTTEPTIPKASVDMSGSVVFLVLPTGQVLEADGTKDVEIYTPSDTTHNAAWEPTISNVPATVARGHTYTIQGVRFNGMSQGSAFGDESQNATNYPLVRITNLSTHHVFYSRTHNHSSMAVASPATVTTQFDVPSAQELGPSLIEVVANGIASQSRAVTVTQ